MVLVDPAHLDVSTDVRLKNFFQFLDDNVHGSRLVIACSGGPDSMCLLHAVRIYLTRSSRSLDVLVCHVNHGLGPQAGQMQQVVVQYCLANGLPYVIETLADFNYQDHGREGAWRAARYDALATVMDSHSTLLTGHTCDDQVETFFLNLARGSGVLGLSAIPVRRDFAGGQLLRPILSWSRCAVEGYCSEWGLATVKDHSNDDLSYARTHVRHVVLPAFVARYAGLHQSVVRSVRYCQQAVTLCADLAKLDWGEVDLSLPIQLMRPLLQLTTVRQVNAIRAWLSQHVVYLPGEERLLCFLAQCFQASGSAVPVLDSGDWRLRFYDDYIFLEKKANKSSFSVNWDNMSRACILPEDGGELQAIGRLPSIATAMVRTRVGGEWMRWRGKRRSLKYIFQYLRVPPWQRAQLPLIFVDDKLVAIADICLSDELFVNFQDGCWPFVWQGRLAERLHLFLKLNQEK